MSKNNGATPSHWGGQVAYERNSGVPLEMPSGACRPMSVQEMIAKYLHDMRMEETGTEPETFAEADDFEEEDPDTLDFATQYTVQEMTSEFDPTYDPDRTPQAQQEAPQEEISTKEAQTPQSKEETPSGASE